MDGVGILDLSIPRKLLLWAYTLSHGCANIAVVVKHCEENAKAWVYTNIFLMWFFVGIPKQINSSFYR
jgi:hypothetical protein